jgi:hypothetical protein
VQLVLKVILELKEHKVQQALIQTSLVHKAQQV